jgi:hypothetical protein
MFLFGRSSKSPQELVKALRDLLMQLEKGEKKYEKVRHRQTDVVKVDLLRVKNTIQIRFFFLN